MSHIDAGPQKPKTSLRSRLKLVKAAALSVFVATIFSASSVVGAIPAQAQKPAENLAAVKGCGPLKTGYVKCGVKKPAPKAKAKGTAKAKRTIKKSSKRSTKTQQIKRRTAPKPSVTKQQQIRAKAAKQAELRKRQAAGKAARNAEAKRQADRQKLCNGNGDFSAAVNVAKGRGKTCGQVAR